MSTSLRLSALSCLVSFVAVNGALRADPIQIDVASVLDSRCISTVVDGKLVPLSKDIDGAGGVATTSAAALQGPLDPFALPDDGAFPATDQHPAFLLPYGHPNAKAPQVRRSAGGDAFVLDVPDSRYTKLFLFLTSGQGPSNITVKLRYTDNTTETRTEIVPDWFWILKPEDKDWCYVATNLSKWGSAKKLENNHHSIFALDIHPNPAKTLGKVLISKEDKGIMVFYGATGETVP